MVWHFVIQMTPTKLEEMSGPLPDGACLSGLCPTGLGDWAAFCITVGEQ